MSREDSTMLSISGKESRIKQGSTTVDTCVIQACICCREYANVVHFKCLAGESVTRFANLSGPGSTWIECISTGDVDVRVDLKGLGEYSQ